MPTYIIEGKRIRAAKPLTDTEIDEIADKIRAQSEEGKRGVYAGLARGTRQMLSSLGTAAESVVDAEQAALSGLERGERIARERGTGTSLEELQRAYERRGVTGAGGEILRSIPEEVATQAPQLALTTAGVKAGALGGAAIGSAFGPPGSAIGATVGGIGGAVIPNYLQLYGEFLQRQAEEDIAAGREVDVSRVRAGIGAAAAVGPEILSQLLVLGRAFGGRLFGDEVAKRIEKLVSRGEVDRAERVAKEGLAKTIAKGTAVGVAAEVPTEVIQTAIERAQAGLSVADDDAFTEYGEVAYKSALAGPVGSVGRYADRRAARAEVERKRQEALDAETETETDQEEAPPPAPPTGFPAPPKQEVASALDDAPKPIRDFVKTLDTPKKVADAIQQFETRLASLAEQLADPEGTEQDARSANMDPVQFERDLIGVADRLNATLPYLRLRYQELSTPIPPEPQTRAPITGIPQTGTAQQQLITPTTPAPAPAATQVDQDLADALNIPGADTAPKGQPVTVATTTPPVPLTQAPSVQTALPLPAESVQPDIPNYQTAVGAVTSGNAFDVKSPFSQADTPDTVSSESLQKALVRTGVRVSKKEAGVLLKQMELEGVLSRPKEGKRTVNIGRRPAPSVSTTTAPTGATQVGTEPTGGGVQLPLSTPAAPRPEAAQPAVAGLDVAERGAPDVVARTERVEPALESTTPRDFDAEVAALDAAQAVEREKIAEIESFARRAAQAAFDFQREYSDLEESIGSNKDNVRDTLNENTFGPNSSRYEEQAFAAYDAEIERLRQAQRKKDADDFDLFRAGEVPPAPVMDARDVQQAANETIQGWTNAPEIVVLDDENDTRIPAEVKKRIKPNTKGFYNKGKTYVIASRASDEADVHATVYHESLGHYGLRQKFKTRLNDLLEDIYRTNPVVRAEADALKTTDKMTNAQAVEEVLAQKSEAGPIKEAGIRAAFNRVAAFVRRVGRAMGINFRYSNNDVAQIIRIAQEKVTKGTREVAGVESVAQAKKIQRGILESSVNVMEKLPILNKPERIARTRAFFKDIDTWAQDTFLMLRSLPEMVDIFSSDIPAIRSLMKIGAARAVAYRTMRENIGDSLSKWDNVLSDKKYKGNVINNFRNILLESTEKQVDFRRTVKLKNGKVVPNKNYSILDPLTAKFEALPEPLKKVYFEMLDSYTELYDKYIDLVTKTLPPTAANILRREIESRRLKIYFPLYREGPYVIRYTHKGEEYVENFNSNAARTKQIQRLEKAGVTNITEQDSLESAFEGATGSLGFFNDINKAIEGYYKDQYGDKAQIPAQLKEAMYKLYLDSIPASSIRQQFRKREGYKGADQDPLRVYAIVATRMASQLTNLEYIPQIDEVMGLIKEDVAAKNSSSLNRVYNELEKRADFLRNPTSNSLINRFVFLSYADYILGNTSSAVANLTNIPTTIYPLLGGEYGYDKAATALEDATAMYFQGGWDSTGDVTAPKGLRKILSLQAPTSDRTIFAEGKIPKNSPLWRLFEEAVNQGAVKQSIGYDIIEARGKVRDEERSFIGKGLDKLTGQDDSLSSYTGKLNRAKQLLGWTFQNSERFNREVSLVAAFRLEMEKARSLGKTGKAAESEAIDKAIQLVNRANGVGLTELEARVFQGYGSTRYLKVAFAFKRYARAMYALQLKLLRDALKGMQTDTTGMSPAEKVEALAADREFRKVAVKQWLGTVGGAFVFAGLQGLPFVGAAKVLGAIGSAMLSLTFGDDPEDEIEDEEENLTQAIGLLGMRGPINQIFGVDMASRTGFNGMFWRDDPRRVDEIGLELVAIEQFLGPAYASLRTRFDAVRDFNAGEYYRGLEKTMPLFARNILKTIRYMQEGVQTKDGKNIVDDINAYEKFMQFFGFTPTKISEASRRAGARKEIVKRVMDRRQSLLREAYSYWSQGDAEGYYEALRDISKWNKTRTAEEFDATIDWDELEQSFKTRSRNAEEALDGVSIPKRYREGAIKRVPN